MGARQLTDDQGQITLAKAYNSYGEVTQSAGAGQSSDGYTGEFQDSSNQLFEFYPELPLPPKFQKAWNFGERVGGGHSTVTLFARLRGWSTSRPRMVAM